MSKVTEAIVDTARIDAIEVTANAAATQLSVSNVDNTSDVDKPISTATQAILDTKISLSVLGEADNTSDADKPVSTAQQIALGLKANISSVSEVDNVADLDKPVSTIQQIEIDTKEDLDPTILRDADIGVSIEARDATILKVEDIGVTLQPYTALALTETDIGVTVQGYDATILNNADIGVTLQAYDATILNTASIHTTVAAVDGSSTQAFSTSNLSVTGTIVASGDVTAFSDKRLKTNILTITDALEKLTKVSGVTFKMGGKAGTGVLAQDLQKVLPEAVHTNEEGMLSVAYGNVIGLLIEAIKELNSKIK